MWQVFQSYYNHRCFRGGHVNAILHPIGVKHIVNGLAVQVKIESLSQNLLPT